MKKKHDLTSYKLLIKELEEELISNAEFMTPHEIAVKRAIIEEYNEHLLKAKKKIKK